MKPTPCRPCAEAQPLAGWLCRHAGPALMPMLESGCVAALGAGSIALTDKTPIDHVYSLVTGKDCSVVRSNQGLTYCLEDEVTPRLDVHCYPTLGETTCYDRRDPYPGGQRELASQSRPAAPPPARRHPRGIAPSDSNARERRPPQPCPASGARSWLSRMPSKTN